MLVALMPDRLVPIARDVPFSPCPFPLGPLLHVPLLSVRSIAFQSDVDRDCSPGYAWRMVDYRKIITIEGGKRSGKPCIRGLRITVGDVLDYLAGGMTIEEILDDFPDLTHEDILACFAFAAERERNLFLSAP